MMILLVTVMLTLKIALDHVVEVLLLICAIHVMMMHPMTVDQIVMVHGVEPLGQVIAVV